MKPTAEQRRRNLDIASAFYEDGSSFIEPVADLMWALRETQFTADDLEGLLDCYTKMVTDSALLELIRNGKVLVAWKDNDLQVRAALDRALEG